MSSQCVLSTERGATFAGEFLDLLVNDCVPFEIVGPDKAVLTDSAYIFAIPKVGLHVSSDVFFASERTHSASFKQTEKFARLRIRTLNEGLDLF